MKELFFIIISAVIFGAIAAVNTENNQFIDRDTESRQLVSLNGSDGVHFVTHIIEIKQPW